MATLILVFHSVLAMDFFLGKDFGFFHWSWHNILLLHWVELSDIMDLLSSLRSHVCLVLCKAMELCVGNYVIDTFFCIFYMVMKWNTSWLS